VAASPHWGTNPNGIINAAKKKARQCVSDKAPKLTALEKAFWTKYKQPLTNHD